MTFLERISQSKLVETFLTACVYSVYIAVIAVGLIPSVWLLARVIPAQVSNVVSGGLLRPVTIVSVALAAAFYVYVVWGSLFQAVIIRLLSAGIKPGRYPAISLTTLRWLIFSGIYTISLRTCLPFVLMTVVVNAYFRIIGCSIGKNVKLNTYMLNDAYLLTIGDNVIIGGDTDVSCHLFENDHLTLKPVTIGSDTLIGAHSYISPGVTIGKKCVIGLYSYIRSNHVVPDGSVITSLAGIDVHTARELERKRGIRSVRDMMDRRA